MNEITPEQQATLGKDWMARLDAQKKAEETWIDNALEAQQAYMAESGDGNIAPQYNILHSNVETIVPATYNSTPSPDIRPRHGNADKIGKVVSDIWERAISAQIDDERLDTEIEATALDAFLTGRGVTRLKYDGQMQDQILQGERVLYENVAWKDYREGPAQRWSQVPWVAFRYHISQEELDRRYGNDPSDDVRPDSKDETDDKKGGVNVWQIWDKQERKVLTVTEDTNKVIKIQDDPLGLKGFFPMPEPVQPLRVNGSRKPICPYSVYRTLANELDTQTRRINILTKGLKLRGFYAGDTDVMETLAEAEDNALVGVADMRSVAPNGDLDKAIAWWPIDKAITVLRELMQQREQTKQAIYEITGISDIVRGASNSKETATAQQIKTQWGSLRIKRLQNMIARHVRDIFIMSAEIMASQFDVQSILKASGVSLELPASQMPPQPQDPAQAAAYQQQVQQMQAEHQRKQAEHQQQVVAMLKEIDHYRIDVESDSTVRADLTQKRGEMAEFLNGTAQFFSTMAPVIEKAPAAAGPIIEMYAAFARQFNLGKQAEDALDEMVEGAKQVNPQQQNQPDPIKMGELKVKEGELGVKQRKVQIDGFKAQNDVMHKQAEITLEAQQQRPVGIG
jgi:DNA-binding transcriptional MerR regulator